jgi:hypothetical protein
VYQAHAVEAQNEFHNAQPQKQAVAALVLLPMPAEVAVEPGGAGAEAKKQNAPDSVESLK